MMTKKPRHYSLLDRGITHFDRALRSWHGSKEIPSRMNPAAQTAENSLSQAEKKRSARLMRVDHVGEVCAQALYQGQALTARNNDVREKMQQSALEENDHLLWCFQRLTELNSRVSYLNPFWYSGALFLGIMAGLAGDRYSLGFLAETEQQVVTHLKKHLQELPITDEKSRAILQQMQVDEQHHAEVAQTIGAASLPIPIKFMMRCCSKVMTTVAYWI